MCQRLQKANWYSQRILFGVDKLCDILNLRPYVASRWHAGK